MIILDNCVLSAFKRLDLFSHLRALISSAITSQEVLNEYSLQWKKSIPDWIKIQSAQKVIELEQIPGSLSSADLSLIRLALEKKVPIASDDKPLRHYAKKLGLSVIGSLALLKSLYKKGIIKTRKEFLSLLELLQEDIYLTEELMKWALED